ncbi:Ig-like domain-containing protein [Thauera sp.]|uniref:beta strand repeat-containing protein n=1 Tax=Thauera sp. TaxID=1905334 RepID=UPI00258A4E99|nr:Ig-like domain-containing protein [Thauera sp.]
MFEQISKLHMSDTYTTVVGSGSDQERIAAVVETGSSPAFIAGHLLDSVRVMRAEEELARRLVEFGLEGSARVRRITLPEDRGALLRFVREWEQKHRRAVTAGTIATLVLPLAACGGGGGGGYRPPVDEGDSGWVIDGYVSAATVSRENVSGNTVTTDASGRFTGLTGTGPIVATGGIDVVTGQPVGFTMRAPEGATVISPLTTLVQALIDDGASSTAAYASVAEKLGLTADQLRTDPFATESAENLAVIKAAVQVASVLRVAVTAGAAPTDAAAALVKALSTSFDLSNEGTLASFLGGLGITSAENLATTLAEANSKVAAADTLANLESAQSLPTVTITLSDVALKAGETATVTFTFSEEPTGFGLEDVQAENGQLTNLLVKADSGGLVYTATFTPNAAVEDTTNVITVGTGWSDNVGNAPAAITTSGNYSIDTKAPTATVAIAADALSGATNGTTVTITFSEVPTGFDPATDLTVVGGTLGAGSFDGTGKVWTATFTAEDGFSSTGSVTLINESYTDAALNLGSGNSDTVAIDTLAPVYQSMTVHSNGGVPGTGTIVLTYGEQIDGTNLPSADAFVVTINGFTNPVSGVSASGNTVTLTLTNAITSGNLTLGLSYTDPTAGNDAEAIQDAAGNDAASLSITTGVVADGYIRGAQMYLDAPGVLQILAGVLTDANGNFFLPDEANPNGYALVAVGGVNIDTGLPNTAELKAPAGATTINPLTTLVQAVIQQAANGGGTLSADAAASLVESSLGLTLTGGVSLLTYNPLADTINGTDVQKAAAQVATILAQSGSAEQTTVIGNLASAMTDAAGAGVTLSLSDSIVLSAALNNASVGESAKAALTDAVMAIGRATSIDEISLAQSQFLDTIAPAAPTSLSVAAVTSDTTPSVRVNLDVSSLQGGAAVVGDKVVLMADGVEAGTATLVAASLAAGYIDVEVSNALPPGEHTFTARLIDQAGNSGFVSAQVVSRIDTQGPTASISADDGQLIIMFSEAVSGFDANDISVPSGITLGTLSAPSALSGGLVRYTVGYTAVQGASGTIQISGGFYTDLAGNSGAVSNALDVENLIEPVVVINSIGGADGVVSGQAGDNVVSGIGASGLEVRVKSGDTVLGTTTADGNGVWSYTLTPANLTALGQGEASLVAEQTRTIGESSITGSSPEFAFSVDTVAPTAPTIAPIATDNAVNAAEKTAGVALTGTVEAGAKVALTLADGVVKQLTADNAGAWSYTLTEADYKAIGTGTTLRTTATDAAGNRSAEATQTITVDTVGPLLTPFSLPTTGVPVLGFTNDSTPTITFQTDASGVDVFVGDSLVVQGLVPSNGTIEYTFTDALKDGSYAIRLIAYDSVGNTTERTSVVKIDATPVAVGSIAAGGNTLTLTFSESVADSLSIGDLTLSSGSFGTGATVTALNAVGGRASVFKITLGSGFSITAGKTISVDSAKLIDVAGNEPGSDLTFVVPDAVDSVPPTATIVSDKPVLKAGETATLTITFSEAVAFFDKTDLTVESGSLGTLSRPTTNGDGTVSYTIGYTPAVNTEDAVMAVRLANTFTDLVGNPGTAAIVDISVDTKPPAAPPLALGVGVAGGATAAEATAGAVTVTGENGASITVTLVGAGDVGGDKTVTKTLVGTGVAQAVTLTDVDLSKLGDGTVSVSASQTDAAGNKQVAPAATTNFTLDTIAPTAPTLSVVAGADKATAAEAKAGAVTVTGENGASITVTLVGTGDNNGDRTVTKTLAGTGAAQVVTLTDADLAKLGDGAIAVSARQTDAAGNAQTAAATTAGFTLDMVPPALVWAGTNGSGTQVVLTFSETLSTSTASASAFVVLVDGEAVTVTAVDVNGVRVVLTLDEADTVGSGQTVTVGYTDPTTGDDAAAVQDLAGNDLPMLGAPFAVVNNVGDTTPPAAPTIALDTDTGASGTDGITKTGSYTVSGTELGALVEYSIDGSNWSTTAPVAVEGANTIQVRQTDVAGNVSAPATLSFVYDKTAPTFSSGATAQIDENVAAGTRIYTAQATDAGTVAYSLSGADEDAFDIDSISGAVTLRASPNFEARPTYSFTVVATDVAGNTANQGVTLSINDVNEVAVINNATALTMESVLRANAEALGIDLTAFDALVSRKSNALADFLANKPTNGFANEAAAKTVFDAVVAANAASEATLAAANAMTSETASESVDTLVAAESAMLGVFNGLAAKGVSLISGYPVSLLVGPFATAVANLGSLGPDGRLAFAEWIITNKGSGYTGLTTLANVSSVAYQKGAFADNGALTVSLNTDSGEFENDGITKDGTITIGNVFTGAALEYRLNGPTTWTKIQSGTSFVLPEGVYAAGDVEVRQTLSVVQLPFSAVDAISAVVALGPVTIDLTPPAAAQIVVAGEEDGLNASEATEAVEVTITPDTGATVVSAKIGEIALEVGTTGGQYTFDATGLAQGPHVITVVTQDLAGNQTTTTKTITIDTVAPVAPTVTAQVTSATSPIISGTAVLAEGEVLSVAVNGAIYDNVSVLNGAWSIETATAMPRVGTTLGAFNDGSAYDIIATVTDAAGNQAADGSSAELRIDRTLPATPTVDRLITNVEAPILTGRAVLAEGETLTVTVDNVDYTTENGLDINADGTWSLALPALPEGVYDVAAILRDAAGNEMADVTASELVIDRTPPQVSISTDDALLSVGDTATITFTFSEEPLTLPDVTSSAGTIGALTMVDANPLVYAATLTAPVEAASGSIGFTVGDWTDAAGNAGSVSGALLVDFDTTTAPITYDSSVALSNFHNANLLALFDGNSSTVGSEPTVVFSGDALTFADGASGSFDLSFALTNAALGASKALVITLAGVPLTTTVTASGTQITLQPGTILGTLTLGGHVISSFGVNNADADVLTVTTGANGLPSIGLKLENLLQKATSGPEDTLDISAMTPEAIGALASAVFAAATATLSPTQALALAQSLITLPSSLDTLGELAAFIQSTFTQPTLSQLTFGDILAAAQAGSLGASTQSALVLTGLALLTDLSGDATLSQVLTAIQANPPLAGLGLQDIAVLVATLGGAISLDNLASDLIGLVGRVVSLPGSVDTVGELAGFIQDNVTALGLAGLTMDKLMPKLAAYPEAEAFVQQALTLMGISPEAYPLTTLSSVVSAVGTLGGEQPLSMLTVLIPAAKDLGQVISELVSAAVDYLVTSRDIKTLGDLIALARDAISAPALMAKTYGEIRALIDATVTSGELEFVLDTLAQLVGIQGGDTLSLALDRVLALPSFSNLDLVTAEGLITAVLGSKITLAGVFDLVAGIAIDVLNASGVSVGGVIELLVSAVDDPAALRSALGAIDLHAINMDTSIADMLTQLAQYGTIDRADLLPIAARTFLGSDGTVTLTLTELGNLGMTVEGRPLDALQMDFAIGDQMTQVTKWSYVHQGSTEADVFKPLAGDTIKGFESGYDLIDLGSMLARLGYTELGLPEQVADTGVLQIFGGQLLADERLDGGDNLIDVTFASNDQGGGTLTVQLDGNPRAGEVSLQTFSIALVASESGLTADDLVVGFAV